MPRTARFWIGVAPLALGGLLLAGASAVAADAPPMAKQLSDLGRQALEQGYPDQSASFYRRALKLDPTNAEARAALERAKSSGVRRVAFQDPQPAEPGAPVAPIVPTEPAAPVDPTDPEVPVAPVDPANLTQPVTPIEPGTPLDGSPLPPPDRAPVDLNPRATIENAGQLELVQAQQLSADVRQRLQAAREQLEAGQPGLALDTLRLARSVISSAEGLPEDVRGRFDRQVNAQYLNTIRQRERIELEQADQLRRDAAESQRSRIIEALIQRQDTVKALMLQFDNLVAEADFRILSTGGTGNIANSTLPFMTARELARSARGLIPTALAPRAGMYTAAATGYLSQSLAFEEIKENRFMTTLQDVERAAVPFPDTTTIEFPPITTSLLTTWERRAERFGRPVSLVNRDAGTNLILRKLDEPITMQFPNETPLEDVLKYIKTATADANYTGIQYYVDPVGLAEADRTMTSPVTIDLESVPLRTAMRLILDQLSLTYTVSDGVMKIDSKDSENLDTEIRVYPVADLALIPISLIFGGGGGQGGGQGGGMGGGGQGGGGMGGGGMGGGGMGGGMGGGGGMGMMSVPPEEPAAGGFSEKKSN